MVRPRPRPRAWGWIVLGLVLIGLELIAPGIFLIWLGLAAVLTGLLDAALGLSWQTALLIFAALAVVAVVARAALDARPRRGRGRPPAAQPARPGARRPRVHARGADRRRRGRVRVDDVLARDRTERGGRRSRCGSCGSTGRRWSWRRRSGRARRGSRVAPAIPVARSFAEGRGGRHAQGTILGSRGHATVAERGSRVVRERVGGLGRIREERRGRA